MFVFTVSISPVDVREAYLHPAILIRMPHCGRAHSLAISPDLAHQPRTKQPNAPPNMGWRHIRRPNFEVTLALSVTCIYHQDQQLGMIRLHCVRFFYLRGVFTTLNTATLLSYRIY